MALLSEQLVQQEIIENEYKLVCSEVLYITSLYSPLAVFTWDRIQVEFVMQTRTCVFMVESFVCLSNKIVYHLHGLVPDKNSFSILQVGNFTVSLMAVRLLKFCTYFFSAMVFL